MEFQHELIIPNEGFPFKVFLFEGGNGNYVREKHWHTSVEIFTAASSPVQILLSYNLYFSRTATGERFGITTFAPA